jgi:hypothetical protein
MTWAGTQFTDVATFSAWLSRHGVRYRAWAVRHPGGSYLITHGARHVRPQPLSPLVRHPASRPYVDSSTAGGATVLAVVFLVAALVLVGLGGFGPRLLVRYEGVPADWHEPVCYAVGAAGCAVLVAVGVAVFV